jgi:hypothetical protein
MGTLLVYNGAKWVSIEPHAFSHATGGKDELMASLIGAATEDYVDSVIAHVADSVIAHVADTDPHPDYLLQSESDTLYDSIGTANAAILSHVQSPDPHPNYLNQLQADSLYDSYGAAASEIGDHLTANNPHPGYLTQSTANALYDFFGTADTKLADHVSLENPHPIYLTQAEGDTVYSALNHNHPYASINHKTQHEPLSNDSLGGYALTVHAHTGSNISGNISGNAANITGIAEIANGGTGASTAAAALTNLGAAPTSHTHAASAINSGTVAIANGGTGASIAAAALTNLGAAPASHSHAASAIDSGQLAIANGGTGASTAAQALINLGAIAASATPGETTEIIVQLTDNSIQGSADASFWYDANQQKGIKLMNVTQSIGWPGTFGGVFWVQFGFRRAIQLWFGIPLSYGGIKIRTVNPGAYPQFSEWSSLLTS